MVAILGIGLSGCNSETKSEAGGYCRMRIADNNIKDEIAARMYMDDCMASKGYRRSERICRDGSLMLSTTDECYLSSWQFWML